MNINAHRRLNLEGIYSLRKLDAVTGELVEDLGSFSNLITNGGLDRIGEGGGGLDYCYLGAGNTPPAFTDNKLQAWVGVANYHSETPTTTTSAPIYSQLAMVYRTAAGAVTGNLSEIGVGWGGNTAGTHTLFSRSLIKNANGDPTTITVLANEILEVTYILRAHPMEVIATIPNIEVFGNMHTFSIKSAYTNNGFYKLGRTGGITSCCTSITSFSSDWASSIQSGPSSGASYSGSPTWQPYVPGSYKRAFSVTWSLNNGNFPTGIRSLLTSVADSGYPMFQMRVDPPIKKENTQTLTFNMEITWGRV